MSRKRKYCYEERLSVVLSVLSGQESMRSAALKLGTDHKHVRRWIALYQSYGEAGLNIEPIRYSGDFKLSVITYMRENHLSLFDTAVQFGIPSDSTVFQWDRIYNNEGPSGLYRNRGRKKMKAKPNQQKPARIENTQELLKELEYLRVENAYLKKLKALVEERILRESGKLPEPSRD
jgi:transposase